MNLSDLASCFDKCLRDSGFLVKKKNNQSKTFFSYWIKIVRNDLKLKDPDCQGKQLQQQPI